jgi:hypothetical protein
VNGALLKDFQKKYDNGSNHVELSFQDSVALPKGKHEVAMNRDGEKVGVVRFVIQ